MLGLKLILDSKRGPLQQMSVTWRIVVAFPCIISVQREQHKKGIRGFVHNVYAGDINPTQYQLTNIQKQIDGECATDLLIVDRLTHIYTSWRLAVFQQTFTRVLYIGAWRYEFIQGK